MEEIAKIINEKIKESNVYKRYLESKKSLESNIHLSQLKEKMEILKKENCKCRNDTCVDAYYEVENEYLSNIIVKEYEMAKKDLNNLLVEICDILAVK